LFISETAIVVRYAETDRMGIVHHSNYPIWFEAGRTDFIRKMGLPYSKIEEMGVCLPLISLKCDFRGAARYEDRVTIKTQVKELTFSRIAFYYEIYINDAKTPGTTGETVHAWTNAGLKPVNIKKYMPQVYEIIAGAASAIPGEADASRRGVRS